MAGSQVRSTGCRVEIVTPEHVRLVFDASETDSALLQVSTHTDMAEACGAFSLTLAGVRIHGRTYDQLIPLRSLVTIWMRASTAEGPGTETVVMLGLTEDHGVTETLVNAQLQRVVTIHGRSMAGVLLDMALRHYPLLEDHIEGTLTVGDFKFNLYIPTNFLQPDIDPREAIRAVLTYFLGVPSRIPLQPRTTQLEQHQTMRQTQARTSGQPPTPGPSLTLPSGRQVTTPVSRTEFLALVDEHKDWMAEHPGTSQGERDAHFQMLLQRGGAHTTPSEPAPPAVQTFALPQNVLINPQLPGRPLADLLDLNDDTWTMFDEDVRINIGQNTPYAVTLWNYVQQFVDHLFQEFFTRVEDGVVKIVFRAKPFQDATTMTGSRFVDNAPTCRTFSFTKEAWDAQYLGGEERRQTANVYNAFLTIPMEAGALRSKPGYEWIFVPVFLSDPRHPSYLAKYGLRELADQSPYITLKKLGDPSPLEAQRGRVERIARDWSRKAANWYGLGPEMYVGTKTVLGNPEINIGHRLLYSDERGEREGYVEGCGHLYDARTGRYVTQLRVTRLWYLSGLTDEREQPSVSAQEEAGALESVS